MITRIEVDGFKTLNNFVFEPKPGLNILVGANGVGKSNILQLFEFLTLLSHKSVSEAVQEMGGSMNVFQKIGDKKFNDTIKITVEGYHQFSRLFNSIKYKFIYKIEIKTNDNEIFYNIQEIKFTSILNKNFDIEGNLHLQFIRIKNNYNINDSQNKFNIEINVLSYDFYKLFDQKMPRYPLSKENLKEHLISCYNLFENSYPTHYSILYRQMFNFFEYSGILSLFKKLNFYNIDPDIAKLPNDFFTTPIIHKNGLGLAATLFDLKSPKIPIIYNSQAKNSTYSMVTPDFKINIFEKIIKFLQAANNNISKLDVIQDDSENKFKIILTIKSEDYESQLPLSSMSDGTIKWLALITAIISSTNSFCIEEPENFLHPWMQDVLITTIREQLESFERPAFVLITTHSETLINFCQPDEIILVDFQNGCTTAKYVNNKNELKTEISRSGNGLGHFYFSNCLIPNE